LSQIQANVNKLLLQLTEKTVNYIIRGHPIRMSARRGFGPMQTDADRGALMLGCMPVMVDLIGMTQILSPAH